MCAIFKNHQQAYGYFIDPTHCLNVPGKYINHAAQGANLKLYPPIHARDKTRVGFVYIKDIQKGEELFWDYGYRSELN